MKGVGQLRRTLCASLRYGLPQCAVLAGHASARRSPLIVLLTSATNTQAIRLPYT
jgi:hypothetical protein